MEHVPIATPDLKKDPLALFNAADGILFWAMRPMILRGGRYRVQHAGVAPGALWFDEEGGAYDKLTVNLVADEEAGYSGDSVALMPAGFFVKLHADDQLPAESLLRLGVFERANHIVASGFVPNYAEAWIFKMCPRAGVHRVLCAGCRAEWAADYEDNETRVLARDTVHRLKGAEIE